jgi:phosphoglycolate phosphatase-like HAD superfamily hydrolase
LGTEKRAAKLVLFDIDGTLVDSGGAGARALSRAMEELTGIRDGLQGIELAGKTDPQIVREGLQRWGLPWTDGLPAAVLNRYLVRLREEVARGGGHVKPGVREILVRLGKAPGTHLGLLTGNVEEGARIKLEPFDLNSFFPLGAFGSDHEDRNRLIPVAARRFMERHQARIPHERCLVIGDTPRDVACARVHGSRCIAVATGSYSMARLEETGADLVTADLSDTDRIAAWIERM